MSRETDYDTLTGLASRPELVRRLRRAWFPRRTRRATPLAVLVLDIDRFRYVNQQFGWEAGDEVLATIAHRLRIRSRPGDLVARTGGDTFVVVLARVTGPQEALGASDRIRLAQLEPIAVGTQWVSVSLSVGIAVEAQGEHPLRTLERAEHNLRVSRKGRRAP